MLADIVRKAREILAEAKPSDESLKDIENVLSSYIEALATERVQEDVSLENLEAANRLLKDIRRERARRLADQQGERNPKITQGNQLSDNVESHPILKTSKLDTDGQPDSLKKFFQSSHDPEADAIMDQAEESFYRGNYQDAIPLYEKVLQLEPGWGRAQEHRSEAEDYLRTGNIPSVALPAEAGKAYGKAQSAARVFRYQIALTYLDEAFTHLEDAGIKRWREGEELRQDLDNQIQAGEVYKEGLNLLKQGDLPGALSLIQTAASAVATPEYIDKAADIRSDLSMLDKVGDVITMPGEIPSDKLADSKAKLERIRLKYGDISQVNRLNNRLELVIPAAVRALTESVQRSIQVAATANTIDIARQSIVQANTQLQLLKQLDGSALQEKNLTSDLAELENKISSLEDTLNRARQSIKSGNRFIAYSAWKMSKDVRNRYPSDPQVLALKKELMPFFILVALAGALMLAIISALLWVSIREITNSVEQRRLALTPTLTPTATLTQTPTMTMVPSLTPTATPDYTPTPTPSLTPTPITIGLTARTLWARNGCYEAFTANGRIEEGSEVTLLPMTNRAFDSLNRECVLVEYRSTNSAIIGFILLADLVIP